LKKLPNNFFFIIGFLAILLFAGTIPATKLVLEIYSPLHVTALRASCATLFAIIFFIYLKLKNLQKKDYMSLKNSARFKVNEIYELLVIGLLIVFGFPGAVAFALAEVSSAYTAVILSMLPLCLSAAAVIMAKEKPPLLFWFYSFAAAALVGIFMVNEYTMGVSLHKLDIKRFVLGNFWLFVACICAAVGYTKSASLNKKISGFSIISWSLCLTSPISFLLSFLLWPKNFSIQNAIEHSGSLLGIMYLGLLSMFIGNCLWSIALSRGGIAKIGQIQFLQPFITIFLSYWLLSELIKKEMIFFACAVTVVVILGQRQRFLD
tara:strand:- start:569 stop:1528 length:960 start_codon:yes stop_codon:yes gene_type:complete